VQFFLILFFLLGYCILCSFTPSVVRASIMSICFLLSKLFERKYDTLNALSLAGIILLVISPTMFFTIGFQLSFLAAFGVISLSKILSFVKFKSDFMQEFWNAIKLSVSAQMGVLPLMFYYFGGVTTWTLLANLLLIPFFTLFYTLLFVCNIIVVIIPSFGMILKVPGILFDLFVYFNNLIISLPGGYIEYSNVNTLSITLYMLFLWCGSKYFVVSGRTRAIIVIILVLCITCALIMGNLNLFGGDVNISPQNLPLKTILAQKCG
jgi:competence protein ComEC